MALVPSPDWLIKKQTSSRNTGVFLSKKSLASSTMTGSSVNSSSTWRVWVSKRGNKMPANIPHTCVHAIDMTTTLCMSDKCGYFCDVNLHITRRKGGWLKDTHCYSSMVAGATGNKDKAPTPLNLFDVVLQSTQHHWKANTTANPSSCSIIFHLIIKDPRRQLRNNVLSVTEKLHMEVSLGWMLLKAMHN